MASKTEETQSANVTAVDMQNIANSTKKLLDAQPKRTVRLRADEAVRNGKAPNFETVVINGYLFQIKKGVDVDVPLSVYEILAESNLI